MTLKHLNFMEHLDELRTRLIKVLIVLFVVFCLCFTFANQIIYFLQGPLLSSRAMSDQVKLYFTGPLDVLFADLKVAFLSALILSSPYCFYQFWKFIEPGLYEREKKYILLFTFASAGLFLAGISFCYLIILPMTLKFLLKLGMEVGTPILTITDYISLLIMLTLGFGLVFETPIIILTLALLEVIQVETLKKYRKSVIVIILIVAAVVTPTTDPFSQLAMAIPTYLMYEISIFVVKIMKRGRKKDLLEKRDGLGS